MNRLLKAGLVWHGGQLERRDISLGASSEPAQEIIGCEDIAIFPGFKDLHVHFREPGFSNKETIASGSLAAARGGYTAVCAMPNLYPAPDSLEHLREQLEIIRRDACIPVYPVGAITMGQKGRGALSDMEALAPYVCGFSDDGAGIQEAALMRGAMKAARALKKPVIAHCEDDSLLRGGYIHDGAYAARHGHRGIRSESEWGQLARDLALAEDCGCMYHACHISTKESVALIRRAKERGLRVSCETAPHYLLLSDADLREEGRFKMNPPLRGEADRLALLEGLRDGTVDIIATDHAPHTAEEKSRGLAGSAFGIVGLECAFALLYTKLVLPGLLPMARLIDAMSIRPRALLRQWCPELLPPEGTVDLCGFRLDETYTIHPAEFASKGRATPFAGWEIQGKWAFTAIGDTWISSKEISSANDKFI
ncbi:MAG: dihydroorotase [Oscillospiraceae bacterium]|nr:dihydroorotase [Oscillospiraceae bacterium]